MVRGRVASRVFRGVLRASEHLLKEEGAGGPAKRPPKEYLARRRDGGVMVLLHGFIKKSQKIPPGDLRTARQRLTDLREE